MSTGDKGVSHFLDSISIGVGRSISWLTLFMVVVTFVIVVQRYVFDTGLIWLQESVAWMHAIVFMLGAAYTLQHDDHVRVDIFYAKMSRRQKAWVDLLGVLIFIFPMCGFFIFTSVGYVGAAWSIHEVSVNSGGLPYPFVPLLKSALVVMPVMLVLQGLAMLMRAIAVVRER